MKKDVLASGAASASFGPIEVTAEKWAAIFGEPEPCPIKFLPVIERLVSTGVPLIDPVTLQLGARLSRRAGRECRELMLQSGLSEAEANKVIEHAFAWRHPKKRKPKQLRTRKK
jgi:hypothetical protein